jgi:hypothetical protein
VFATLKHNLTVGFSIANYGLTCLGLVTGLFTLSEWVGLKKPDPISFNYNVEQNVMVSETHVQHLL